MQISGFDWDQGNLAKCQNHGVSITEIEKLFESSNYSIFKDALHSDQEPRYQAIGNIDNRYILAVFTIRVIGLELAIRPISVRYMHDKEIKYYENRAQKAAGFDDR